VTRPFVLGRITDHASAHRVQVNVSDQLEQVSVDIDEPRSVAALEEVSSRSEPSLVVTSVAAGYAMHQSTERRFGHLREQMQMIAHPAVSMQSRTKAREDLADDLIEARAIAARVEDALPVVAPQHDVIDPSRNVQSGAPRHPCLQSQPGGRLAYRRRAEVLPLLENRLKEKRFWIDCLAHGNAIAWQRTRDINRVNLRSNF
jgi:hypothetical protein